MNLQILVTFIAILLITPSVSFCSTLKVDSGLDVSQISLGLNAVETETSYTIANQIYDRLLNIDSKGSIVPALAESWNYIDSFTLELKLKKGIAFHDGEPLSASCVKFSLEYFIGSRSFASQMLEPINKVEIIDSYTVRIKTKKIDGLLLQRLAFWGFIYPFNYVNKFGAKKIELNPNGTGPYVFDSVVENNTIILKKNENYWNKDVFLFDRVFIDNRSNNKLGDIVVNPEAHQTLQLAKSGFYKIRKIPSLYETYGIFNLRNQNSPIQDIRIRKAINLAFNREALQNLVLKGNGRILSSLSMPGEFGHNSSLSPYKFDLLKAKYLIATAGYPKGLTLKVGLQPDVSPHSNYIKFLTSSLKQANIVLNIDENFNLDEITAPNTSNRFTYWNGDLIIGGDPSPYGHSDFIIYQFFTSGAVFNMFQNPEFDNLYSAAASSLNIAEQDLKYQGLDKYIYDNVLALFSHQQIRIYAIRNAVGYDPPKNGILDLRYVRNNKK